MIIMIYNLNKVILINNNNNSKIFFNKIFKKKIKLLSKNINNN
jgi:hypothetical protein